MENLFEFATKNKVRFETQRGDLSAEELWDVPLTNTKQVQFSLDEIAKGLNRELKSSEEESFVVTKSNKNSLLEAKFEIVKRIIEVRLEELKAKQDLMIKKGKRQQIMALIADKENDALRETPLEDLKKMLDDI